MDLVLAVVIILVLFFVRDTTKAYLVELRAFSPQLVALQQNLAANNISTYDYAGVAGQIDRVDALLTRGLLLMKVLLPIVIFVCTFVVSFMIWRFLVKITFWRFLAYSLPLYAGLFVGLRFFFGFLSFILLGEGAFNGVALGLLLILLMVYGYVYVISLVQQKTVKENASIALKQVKRFAGWYLVFVLSLLFNIALIVLLFILSWVQVSIIIPAVLLIGGIAGMAFMRLKLVRVLRLSESKF